MINSDSNKTKPVPHDIEIILSAWSKYYHFWWFIHYLLGCVGTVFAITVASRPNILSTNLPYLIDIIAWISAICMALITFLMPSRRAKAYVAAWRVLYHAINRYKHNNNSSINELLDALRQGEDIIAPTDP